MHILILFIMLTVLHIFSWEEDYLPTSRFTKEQNIHMRLKSLSPYQSGIKE
jgi:hypothetical protein